MSNEPSLALSRVQERIAAVDTYAKAIDVLDPIVGLIFPIGGDLIMGAAGLRIPFEALRAGAPLFLVTLMLANVAFDTVLGFLPGIGDVADIYPSNVINLRIFKSWAAGLGGASKEAP